jgi:type IV pilus assembly protein PilO
MANLSRTRQAFQRIAIGLAVVSFAGGIYLLAPVRASSAQSMEDLKQLQKDYKAEYEQVAPLRGLPEKLVKSRTDIAKFYAERLPARNSTISSEIGRLAKANHVSIEGVKYTNSESDIQQLSLAEVDATISGEYANVAKFINSVERNKTFFLIDSLDLADEKSGSIKLILKMETYLRPASAADYKAAPNDEASDDEEQQDEEDQQPAPSPKVTPKVAPKGKTK